MLRPCKCEYWARRESNSEAVVLPLPFSAHSKLAQGALRMLGRLQLHLGGYTLCQGEGAPGIEGRGRGASRRGAAPCPALAGARGVYVVRCGLVSPLLPSRVVRSVAYSRSVRESYSRCVASCRVSEWCRPPLPHTPTPPSPRTDWHPATLSHGQLSNWRLLPSVGAICVGDARRRDAPPPSNWRLTTTLQVPLTSSTLNSHMIGLINVRFAALN